MAALRVSDRRRDSVGAGLAEGIITATDRTPRFSPQCDRELAVQYLALSKRRRRRSECRTPRRTRAARGGDGAGNRPYSEPALPTATTTSGEHPEVRMVGSHRRAESALPGSGGRKLCVNGPVTVTEEHRYARTKPTTAHQVEGQTLRLTQSGCGDDETRCNVEYRIRMPAAISAEIIAEAGAVRVDNLSGTSGPRPRPAPSKAASSQAPRSPSTPRPGRPHWSSPRRPPWSRQRPAWVRSNSACRTPRLTQSTSRPRPQRAPWTSMKIPRRSIASACAPMPVP